VDRLAESIRDNIGIARARLSESYDQATIDRACRDRIEGLRASFARKLEDLKRLAERCGITTSEILTFECLATRTLPSECTGFLSAGSASRGGVTINAKVRDLDARYIQGIAAYPRAAFRGPAKRLERFPANSLPEAYSFVGCGTLGKWGVGMGINEFGVSVGDHTSYANDPLHPGTGLESNDVCRLVLEGSRTAGEGARLVKELVEGHGHSREGQMYFIADSREGWIVEATSERCAGVAVRDAAAARANGYKIGSEWDAGSADLAAYARRAGLWDGRGRFDFARSYSKPFPWASDRRFRYARAMELLSKGVAGGRLGRARSGVASVAKGSIDLGRGFRVLSDHAAHVGAGGDRRSIKERAISAADVRCDPRLKTVRQICSHLRFPSVSAMVAVHDPGLPIELGSVAWVCLGNPCLGVYVPVSAATGDISSGFADGSIWGMFTQIERASRGSYTRVRAIARRVLDPVQSGILSGEERTTSLAREFLAAGKAEDARHLLQRYSGSAYKACVAAARAVLSRLRESGF
jgi:dipeptidase